MIIKTDAYTIYATPYKHHIDFEFALNNDILQEGFDSVDAFIERFSCLSPEMTFFRGSIKWDGCSNWSHGTCMIHFCDPDDIDAFSHALHQCYDLAQKTFGTF